MYIKAPYVYYDKNVLYPVVKGEGAHTSSITVDSPKKLAIDFNCLGVDIRTTIILYIEILYYQTVKVVIEKECSKEGFIDKLAEKVVAEEEKFGILKIMTMCILLLLILYVGITCYNLYKGKKLAVAVPCGGKLISRCLGTGENDNNAPAEIIDTNNPVSNFSELSVSLY